MSDKGRELPQHMRDQLEHPKVKAFADELNQSSPLALGQRLTALEAESVVLRRAVGVALKYEAERCCPKVGATPDGDTSPAAEWLADWAADHEVSDELLSQCIKAAKDG